MNAKLGKCIDTKVGAQFIVGVRSKENSGQAVPDGNEAAVKMPDGSGVPY